MKNFVIGLLVIGIILGVAIKVLEKKIDESLEDINMEISCDDDFQYHGYEALDLIGNCQKKIKILKIISLNNNENLDAYNSEIIELEAHADFLSGYSGGDTSEPAESNINSTTQNSNNGNSNKSSNNSYQYYSEDCQMDDNYIVVNGQDYAKIEGNYIRRLSDSRDIGKIEGNYIVRLSDLKSVARQDGEYVVNLISGGDIGRGNAAVLAVCAGLLY
jgi:hypothetical protein